MDTRLRRAAGARLWRRTLLAAIGLLAACSDSSTPAKPAVIATPVDPATAGTIQVEVRYDGPVPTANELVMRSVPQCAAAHPEPVYDPSLVVQDGHVANAVVWIKQGLEKWVFAPPTEPVTVDQKGCLYHPHVAAVMVNQPMQFVNSDPEPHNVHGRPKVIGAWNFMISRQGATRTVTFDKPEIAVPIGCDIHPWMSGFVAVMDNPYFAVTPPSGSVTLSKVPPGDYVVAMWHEKLGTREERVTLAPSGTASVRFTLSGGS